MCPANSRLAKRFAALLLSIFTASLFFFPVTPAAAWDKDDTKKKSEKKEERAVKHPKLKPGFPVEQEVASGQAHTFRAKAKAGELLSLMLEPRAAELKLTVTAPDGKQLLTLDRATDDDATAPILVLTEAAGYYLFELRGAEENKPARYRVLLTEQRPATQQDHLRLAADRLMNEALTLRAEKKPETRQQAKAKYEEALRLRRELNDGKGEAAILHELGALANEANERQPAIEYLNQALLRWRALGNRKREGEAQADIGNTYNALGNFAKAIEHRTLARQIYRDLKATREEAFAVVNIGAANYRLRNYAQAIEHFNQALPLLKQVNDRATEAQTLYLMGRAYEDTGNAPSALNMYNKVLEIRRELKDQPGEASTLVDLGAVSRATGEYRQAVAYYQQALTIFKTLGRRSEAAQTHNFLGITYKLMGEKPPAIEHYQQALALARELKNRQLEFNVINNLGAYHNVTGEPQKALEYYQQALPVRRELNDRYGEASTLNNMASVYSDLGDNYLALEHYRRALPLWREVNKPDGEAITIQNIGEAYDLLGEKQLAFDHYQQALTVARARKLTPIEATALTNTGTVYASLGEQQQALGYYQQALALARQMNDQPLEASTLHVIGYAHYELGEKEQAIEHYELALPLWRKMKDKRGEANTLGALGFVYLEMGRPQQAQDYFNQALPAHREVGNRGGQADTLTNQALVHYVFGQQQQAREALQQALQLAQDISDPRREVNTRYHFARFEANAGNLAEAIKHIEAAILLVETIRTRIASQDLRTSYFAASQKYYDLYISLLMRRNDDDKNGGFDGQALQVSERARARSLIEMLAEAGANIRNGVEPALLERERKLQQQINKRAEAFANAKNDEQIASLRRELDDLGAQYRDVQASIRQTSPRYAALTQPQPLSAEQIQKQVLDDDTVLLEYALGEEQSYLWAVTPDSLRSYKLPRRSEIEAVAQRLYELLTVRDAKQQRGLKTVDLSNKPLTPAEADARYWGAAAELSRMILAPIAAQLHDEWRDKRLLVVADGALQYLPFGALPEPAAERKSSTATQRKKGARPVAASPARPLVPTPLIVNHEIVLLPSASTAAVLRRETAGRTAAAKLVSIVADPVFDQQDERLKKTGETKTPEAASDLSRVLLLKKVGNKDAGIPRLPATRDEAERIFAIAPPEQASKALDFAANRAAITNPELSQYRIIHLATHAYFDSERPELSAILLSLLDEAGQPQDGFLRSHEIYNLNLPAELVVLSACETGLGKQIKGEGLVGLTRGFMYAGAPRVVVSLWAVSDKATAELMTRFYRKMLNEKARPAAALRAAQVELWREKQWQAPYYWAAFTLQGEWR